MEFWFLIKHTHYIHIYILYIHIRQASKYFTNYQLNLHNNPMKYYYNPHFKEIEAQKS